jgi:hypothetical protein
MTDTDKLSAMTLAIMEAGAEFREHSKFNTDVTELVLASALGPAIRAAILAYLSALVEDEGALHAIAHEVWDGLSASGLAYEAEERRAKLSAKCALNALLTRAKGEIS